MATRLVNGQSAADAAPVIFHLVQSIVTTELHRKKATRKSRMQPELIAPQPRVKSELVSGELSPRCLGQSLRCLGSSPRCLHKNIKTDQRRISANSDDQNATQGRSQQAESRARHSRSCSTCNFDVGVHSSYKPNHQSRLNKS